MQNVRHRRRSQPDRTEKRQYQKALEIVATLAHQLPGANAELHDSYRALYAELAKDRRVKALLDDFRKRLYQAALLEGLGRGLAITELHNLDTKQFPEYPVLLAQRGTKETSFLVQHLDDARVTLPRVQWKREVRKHFNKPNTYEPGWVEAYSILSLKPQILVYLTRRRQLAERVEIAHLVYNTIANKAQIANLLDGRDPAE